jgi:GT2 family glycosyltransferase
MTPPVCSLDNGMLYRLQGIDRSMIGDAALYLASAEPITTHGPLALANGDWLGSGTFRNSFYVETWKSLSRVQDLWLALDMQGTFAVQVMLATLNRPAVKVMEFVLEAGERRCCPHAVALPADLPEGCRLFWHVEAIGDAVLFDAVWCTRTPPRDDMRLAVLMRTYGRAADQRAQLQRFADAMSTDAHHAAVLALCDFWVLDASAQPDADWNDADRLGLRLRVLAAPNLGGGGNMAHVMARFLAANSSAGLSDPATEVLIVDDDMCLSMESLARYVASCSWRRCEYITSVPVLMKSRPTTVWEDGGFWGRDGFRPNGTLGTLGTVRSLSPHLLRHGLDLTGYEHLDLFGPLNRCEYSTFIFFGLPLSLLHRMGLPAPFFLRGDDIEWSLRALALGVTLVTNPNLATWHEPGHGYGQEYMAILHGAIINLGHSDNEASHFLDFFERRLVEHASLGDLEGIALYQRVLDDLLDSDTRLFTESFEQHYRDTLPRLGAPMAAVTDAELQRLRAEAGAGRLRLVPYLYPGLAPLRMDALGPCLLINEAAQTCRALSPSCSAQRLAATQHFVATLQRFDEAFDALQACWRSRLSVGATAAFWDGVMERHAPATRDLGRFEFRKPACKPAAAVARRPSRKPVQESSSRRPAWFTRMVSAWRSPARGMKESKPSGRPAVDGLPRDFNATDYLSLHADVARTGIDPALHYLRYGRTEGRRYRLS